MTRLTAIAIAAALGIAATTAPVAAFAAPPAPVTPPAATPATQADRFEGFNRKMYAFNRAIDRVVLKPVAKGYVAIVPKPVRTGVSNFLGNLAYPTTIVNDLLQGKVVDGTRDVGRFLLNSTVGIGGVFDPATRAGLVRNDEDFGQTLGAWGVPSGPYLMLPFLGPTTLRDAPTIPLAAATDVGSYHKDQEVRLGLKAMELVDLRAGLLPLDETLDKAFDPYVFVRDAYLQRREYSVRDGDVPSTDEQPIDDPLEDPAADPATEAAPETAPEAAPGTTVEPAPPPAT